MIRLAAYATALRTTPTKALTTARTLGLDVLQRNGTPAAHDATDVYVRWPERLADLGERLDRGGL